MFYNGVTFGLTAKNVMEIDFTSKNIFTTEELYTDIQALPTKPSHIIRRYATLLSILSFYLINISIYD
jgi:hypothetical protein